MSLMPIRRHSRPCPTLFKDDFRDFKVQRGPLPCTAIHGAPDIASRAAYRACGDEERPNRPAAFRYSLNRLAERARPSDSRSGCADYDVALCSLQYLLPDDFLTNQTPIRYIPKAPRYYREIRSLTRSAQL